MGKQTRDSAALLIESMSRMGVGFLVSVLLARYYGREGLGVITTGTAWVTIFLGFSALGLSGVLVKEFVARVDMRGSLLLTVTVAKLAAAAVLLGIMLVTIHFIGSDPGLLEISLIMGLGWVFACLDTVDCLYNADKHFIRLVSLRLGGLAISTSVKVLAIILDWGLIYVALGYALDFALVYLLPAVDFFVRTAWGGPGRAYTYTVDIRLLRDLLHRSWPVLVSGGFAQLNLRIDSLLIAALASISSVGLYSSATRLSEAWSVLAMSIVTATFPGLVQLARSDVRAYAKALSRLLRVLIWIAVTGAIAVSVLAPTIIFVIYGERFASAAPVLAIHIFGGVFLFLRTAVSRWLIIEDLLKLSLVSHAFGAAVNVSLNLILIPQFSIVGAAWASVASYATSAFLFLLVTKRSRPLFFMILWSALPARIAAPHTERLAVRMTEGRMR